MKLIIDNTRRATVLPDDWFAERLQIDEPRLHTTDELIFAAYLSGFAGCMGTVALAFVWSFLL